MATIDGSIQLVKVVTDAELRQSGGSFVVAGRMAQPIQGFDILTKRASGGNAIPVYVVSDAQIANGTFRLKGGSALPMANIDVVGANVKTVQGAAIPVYVVSGSALNPNIPVVPTATYTVTTTGAQTHTINSFGVAVGETVTIDWGDGSTSDFTGTALRTHDYAEAGDWTVTIYTPEHVRTFDMRDNKVALNSANVAVMSGTTTLILTTLKGANIDSADVSSWNPNTFRIFSLPAGTTGRLDSADMSGWVAMSNFYIDGSNSAYTGTFDSTDITSWNPLFFRLGSMPAGYVGTFDSTHITSWSAVSIFWLQSMPAGYTITITDDGFAGLSACTSFMINNNGLPQSAVNTILYDLYQASIAPRTATAGTINVGGTNAAPSGTFQAAASCPVTLSTPGKEVAHELLNDGCAAGFNVWGTVIITA